jgi:hypothetical protein
MAKIWLVRSCWGQLVTRPTLPRWEYRRGERCDMSRSGHTSHTSHMCQGHNMCHVVSDVMPQVVARYPAYLLARLILKPCQRPVSIQAQPYCTACPVRP